MLKFLGPSMAWRVTQLFFGEVLAAGLAMMPCFLLPTAHPNLEMMAGLVSGAAVYMGIWCCFTTSGAHINPMVTLAAAMTRRISLAMVPVYLIGQFAGTAAACYFGYSVSPYSRQLPGFYGMTLPGADVTSSAALATEAVTTFSLIIVVLASLDELRDESWQIRNGNNFPFAVMMTLAVNIILTVGEKY